MLAWEGSHRKCERNSQRYVGRHKGITEFETQMKPVRSVLTPTTRGRRDGKSQRYKSGPEHFLRRAIWTWLKRGKKIKCLVVKWDQLKAMCEQRFQSGGGGTGRGDRLEGHGGLSAQRVGGHAVAEGPPLRPQHQHLRLQGTTQGH